MKRNCASESSQPLTLNIEAKGAVIINAGGGRKIFGGATKNLLTT